MCVCVCVSVSVSVSVSVCAGIAREELKLHVEEEIVIPGLGYSVDVMLPEIGVGVEFDGPTHFISDLSSGADTRFNGSVNCRDRPSILSEREREGEREREKERDRERVYSERNSITRF